MASALEYMHSRRVLHRDLKSTNVFVTKLGELKLGDLGTYYKPVAAQLGIAKVLESTIASATSVVGTPQYLSPELCENRPYSYSLVVFKKDLH